MQEPFLVWNIDPSTFHNWVMSHSHTGYVLPSQYSVMGSTWGYSLDTEWKTMLYKTSRWTYILGLLERSSRITSRASSAVHRLHSKSSGTWYKVLIGYRDLCFYFSWPIVSILTRSGWLLDRCNWMTTTEWEGQKSDLSSLKNAPAV